MKKLLSIILVVCLVVSLSVPVFAAGFTDTENHWAEGSITRWVDHGILDGISGSEFDPSGAVTRAHAAEMLVNLLKLETTGDISGFTDIDPDAWYAEYISKCVAAGYMNGVGNGLMDPNGLVTREQMMVMLCRAIGIKPQDTIVKEYRDADDISDWAEGYINALVNEGIVSGMSEGVMAPDKIIDRACAMTLLDKSIAVYACKEGETVEAEEGVTGIVLVAAPNVTVTGTAANISIVEGAKGGTTTLSEATVGEVIVSAEGSDVVLAGSTTAESVEVAETASGSTVTVEENAQAGTVTSAAPESSVEVEGTVENVEVSDTASNATIETGDKAIVGSVYTSAEGTTVSGSGTVSNVTTSGNNTNVQTDGTKVEAAEGTTGTTAGGETIEGGDSAVTAPSEGEEEDELITPDSSVHRHNYSYTSNGNGTHKNVCSCETRTKDCTFGDDSVCIKCGYLDGAVAQIGSTYYTDLQTAVNVGGNITLLKNVTVETSIEIGEGNTVVLNLNGKKIIGDWNGESTTNHIYAINNYGTFTVNDSKRPSTGAIVSRGIYNYGTMILNSGTIDACDGNGGYAINGQSGSSFTMNGGSVITSYEDGDAPSAGYDATTIKVPSGATATINGGTINNISNYTFAIDNSGTVSITGGTIASIHSTISTYGTLTISGGTFTCNGLEGITAHVLVAWNGSTTNVTGGTFNGKDNYNGFNIDAGAGAVVNVSGGIFQSVHSGSLYGEGTINVTGGTFFDKPAALRIASGYKAVESKGNWIIVESVPGEVLTAAEAQEALDNATSGTVIRLVAGVNYGSLKFRANPEHSNTTQIDVANAYAYDYVRSIENITIIGAAGAKVDGFIFETGAKPGDWHVTMDIKNLVIDGVEFTDVLTASSAGYNAPIFITTSNATVDGLTVKNCKLIGNNNKLNLVYLYGADGTKDVTLTGNTVDGIARLCEIRGTENVTISGNTIKNTYEHGMLLAGSGYSGNIIITGNTAEGNNDRFVRMAGAGSANVVITGNTITNYMGADDNYIKITNSTATPTIKNNTITDATDGNREFTVTVE